MVTMAMAMIVMEIVRCDLAVQVIQEVVGALEEVGVLLGGLDVYPEAARDYAHQHNKPGVCERE